VSIITTRQRTCLSAFAGKLDLSSREDLAVRRYETCQTYNKKCRGEAIRKQENIMGENKDLVGSWSFS
jgi:hypothetical protein